MKDHTQDFIKILKNNYRRRPGRSEDDKKVLCRTRSTMTLDGLSAPAERFYRTRDQQNLAFFTPQNVPYRPLGEPCLDAFGLVLNSMQDGLSDQVIADALRLKEVPPKFTSKYDTDQKNEQNKTKGRKGVPLPELKETMYHRHLASKSAGMENIHSVLFESDNRLAAVRAGQSYVQHFLEYHAKKAIERLRDEDEVQASEAVAIKTFSSNYLLAAIGTTNDVIDINSRAVTDSPTDGDTSIMSGRVVKDPETLREEIKLAAFLEKLDTIHTILSMISNMTPRHLKQYVPLDHEQLKLLKRCPFSKLPGIENSHRDFARSSRQTDGLEFGTGKFRKKNHTSSTASVRSVSSSASGVSILEAGAGSHTPGGETGNFRALAQRRVSKRMVRPLNIGSSNRRSMPHSVSIREDLNAIETWEDLVKGPRRKGISRPRTAKWFHLTQENLVPVKDDNSETIPMTLADHFPTGTACRYRAKYILANEELQSNAEKIMAKHSEERLGKCQLLWKSLADQTSRIPWKQQRHAMNKFNEMNLTKQRDHHNLSPWFDELNAEAVLLYNSIEPHVEKALDRMSTFAKANIDNIPNGKERLCLLAFSLPYYDIKQLGMQTAIKFVLTNVFKQREEMFDLWLNERKI